MGIRRGFDRAREAGEFSTGTCGRVPGVGGPGHRRGVVDKKCPAQPGTNWSGLSGGFGNV